ncbi:MAG: hypothetical protein KBD62_32185 [Kofleriaceae bacterium]|nr:hypothetical protein [Kofleriaceae bacterium]
MSKSALVKKAEKAGRLRTRPPTESAAIETKARESRREFARVHLLKWVPRLRVAEMLVNTYDVSRSVAYEDCKAVWEDVASAQRSTREADAAKLIAIIEEQIAAIVETAEDKINAAERARVVDLLTDRLAKLTGAYPERKRELASTWAMLAKVGGNQVRVEEVRAAAMTDEELQAQIAGEERRLGLGMGDADLLAMVRARFGDGAVAALREQGVTIAAAGVVIDAESEET